jgi:hypothetical protein
MVDGCVGGLFDPAPQEAFSSELFSYGVVPMDTRRSVYLDTLRQVIMPGFGRLGVNTSSLLQWADEMSAGIDTGYASVMPISSLR